MSGNGRVCNHGGPRIAHHNTQALTIDAHDAKSGEFTEARTVAGGKKIYLTPEGAEAFDRLAKKADDAGEKMVFERDDTGQSLWSLFQAPVCSKVEGQRGTP